MQWLRRKVCEQSEERAARHAVHVEAAHKELKDSPVGMRQRRGVRLSAADAHAGGGIEAEAAHERTRPRHWVARLHRQRVTFLICKTPPRHIQRNVPHVATAAGGGEPRVLKD